MARLRLLFSGVALLACAPARGAADGPFPAWKRMGSPLVPTPGQYLQLEKSGVLELLYRASQVLSHRRPMEGEAPAEPKPESPARLGGSLALHAMCKD